MGSDEIRVNSRLENQAGLAAPRHLTIQYRIENGGQLGYAGLKANFFALPV
jgi:hypothetical protein